ncbi:type 1 glutamine amidotransferase domain-containing protein [Spongiactinospora sp. TRM90649]|uniref:type 1 glutamine amidotransferase domain-containing protein n=1 Tax=Spongiactinospora sp. TRM90649 TaxID=3031114 RepID=UPI0023F95320|nr:type 1 glutamine amidotransferase domain-containing protein [Spongiactinospora sp. TRM90649]MDF5756953.1 type 1 glutamine amidotransferase domain-containing protein [Spongiactinospora sp. TRM90649]
MNPTLAIVALTAVDTLPDGRRTGYWLAEAAYPWIALRDAGWTVLPVSTCTGRPPCHGIDRSDPVQRRFMDDPEVRRALEDTRRPEFYDAADVGAVVFAGGLGAMWDLAGDAELAALTGEVWARGGVVAACCHGAAGFLNVTTPDGGPLVAGHDVTAISNEEEWLLGPDRALPFLLADQLAAQGGRYSAGPPFKPHVVSDGRLLTGQNPASVPRLSRMLVGAGLAVRELEEVD